MKVLVIQPKIGLGDMCIYLSYISAIAKKFNTKISLLVKDNSRAKDLLFHDSNIDEIILLDRTKDNLGSHDGIKGFFNLVKNIKSKNFDRVFIFNSSLRYFLISKVAGIKNISQYPLFRKADNIFMSAKIFTERELNEVVSTQPILCLNKEEVNKIKNQLVKGHKHICLGFSASGPTKRWDIKNYIKLCEKLNEHTPCIFYLAGGKNDKELIDLMMKSKINKNFISFSNLKIKETLPIIKNCDLYCGNDTGWLHISCALGLKCLALFCDSPVNAYGKYSKNIFVIVPDGETEESTSHNTLGKDKISFEKVYAKAIELLT